MSKKNLDGQGRWRSKTIAFRISPEENDELNLRVRLSGLSKQDYITMRCLQRDITVVGNSRIYKALKTEMDNILKQLRRLELAGDGTAEFWNCINTVAETYTQLNEDCGKES